MPYANDPVDTLLRQHLADGKTSIDERFIDAVLGISKLEDRVLGKKTSVVILTMPSGFEIVEVSSCVDPAQFEHEYGVKLCMDRLRDRIGELLGYHLQSMLRDARQQALHDECREPAPLACSETEFIINGEKYRTVDRSLTYEGLVALAKMSGTPTVTWRRAGLMGGVLRPGMRLTIVPGLVVNMAHTGGA